MSKAIQPGSAHIATAIASADAFISQAGAAWSRFEEDPERADETAGKHIGELIASATNLSLAIELYLKALLLERGLAAKMTHELPELFRCLPRKIQLAIEAKYDVLRESEELGGLAGLSLHISKGPSGEQSFDRPPGTYSMNFMSVLKRNATAFVTWRYLFAHGPTASGSPLSYEYVRLCFVAQALRLQLTSASAG